MPWQGKEADNKNDATEQQLPSKVLRLQGKGTTNTSVPEAKESLATHSPVPIVRRNPKMLYITT